MIWSLLPSVPPTLLLTLTGTLTLNFFSSSRETYPPCLAQAFTYPVPSDWSSVSPTTMHHRSLFHLKIIELFFVSFTLVVLPSLPINDTTLASRPISPSPWRQSLSLLLTKYLAIASMPVNNRFVLLLADFLQFGVLDIYLLTCHY